MSEATHTPGPWEIEGNRITALGRGIIAVTPMPQDGGTFDVKENARLIAASPDLLESCQSLMRLLAEAIMAGMPIRPDVADARNKAVAAINKATGKA